MDFDPRKMVDSIPLGYQSGMYDSAFLGILQHSVKLPQFLDVLFSFLARRTDFYVILKKENPKMGFLPGVAEEMVRTVRNQRNYCSHSYELCILIYLTGIQEVRGVNQKEGGGDAERKGN